jgi:hypothetical protein
LTLVQRDAAAADWDSAGWVTAQASAARPKCRWRASAWATAAVRAAPRQSRKHLVEDGLEAVLSRKPRAAPAVTRIFDGEKEAKLIALACSEPPEGRARWTLRLLENKVVELNIVDRASDSTIGPTLKKTFSSRI